MPERERMTDREYLEMAREAANHADCLHRKVGAVLVSDGLARCTGHNHVPRRTKRCLQCARTESGKRLHECNAIHAEEDVIIWAMNRGQPMWGSDLYCTLQPCFHCAKLIIQAGIRSVIYIESYPDRRGLELLEEAGIPVKQVVI